MPNTARFDADADGNSLVTQLTVPVFTSNIWKSGWVDATAHRRLTGIVRMDQASATLGIVIEQSESASPSGDSDADYWTETSTEQKTNSVTAVTNHRAAFSVERIALYARLIVKHAGVAPTVFKARLVGAGIT